MGTTRKTITVTDQLDAWIKARIASGRFTNDSEYIRHLIRRDEQQEKLAALQSAIHEGLDSGVSDRSVPQIVETAEARLRADGRL